MANQTVRGTAKDKILETALEIFYKQGYNATGIQQVINEAGVSKTTFFVHYKTKEDLGVAVMQFRHRRELQGLKDALGKFKTPHEKFVNFPLIVKTWMLSTEFRGCAFANTAAEIPDPKNPMRKESKFHYETFRALIKDFTKDLIASNKKYAGLNADVIGDNYFNLMIGTIINSTIYQDLWPFDQALKSVKGLIGE